MTKKLNEELLVGCLGIVAALLAGCGDDGIVDAENQTATNVTTVTNSDVGTSTVTVTVTDTETSTSTGQAGTDTDTSIATSLPTATATTTRTMTATTTVIATSTATVSATSTTTFVYNGYVSATLNYPPAWKCPADFGNTATGGTGGLRAFPTDGALAASDCKSLASLRRPVLKAESLEALDMARSSLTYANCIGKTEQRCLDKNGTEVARYYCAPVYSIDAGAMSGPIGSTGVPRPSGGAGGSNGATEYSTTNTQVASVDEADYVKNDGNSIFVLSADGLHVIDAWPAAETHEVAHVSLPGEPRRLFFADNRLVVYTRIQATAKSGGAGTSNPSDQGCTYGYDCRFSSEGGHTMIQVFDVTTPATPVELMRYELSGGYVDSRRVGSFIYTVVHDTGATQIPGLDTTLYAKSYEDLQAKYTQRVAENNAKIDGSSDDYFLPWVHSRKPDGTTTVISACQQALAMQGAQGASFVSINTFDLATLGQPTRTVIASNAGYVYASPTSLYMAVDRTYEQDYLKSGYSYYPYSRPADSFVHKFNLNGTNTSYVGSVTLPGHILNQFAMDEFDGVLRVASTKGWVPDPQVMSYLTTFGMQAGKLVQLGQVGGIGPQEDIRSVRFDGNRGYVVTFKKTDPLFVFDLTDATNPKVMGELKIPGFSTYMQPLDDTHIMAVGFTADDHESFAFFDGIQIQIFDVSDLANPKVAWKHTIGTRGSSSEALTNHLAFNYFAPKKMLALPITVCEGGGNGTFGSKMTFAGLMAFDISLTAGITEHGRLPFVDASSAGETDSCGKWWTDSKSLVKRSIFMDDFVYGLSDAQLRVAGLASMSTVLQSVPLGGP